jgi:hypothetical protein
MITCDQIKKAYDALLKADETQYQADENVISRKIQRENAFRDAMTKAATALGIMDENKQKLYALEQTSDLLTSLQDAEKVARLTAEVCRQSAMKVDCLNAQLRIECREHV